MSDKISLKQLLDAGAHFGHQTRRWNPKMAKYIYGSNDDVHIFDLEQTAKLLEEAIDFLKEAKKQGKTILLVGTKKQAKDKIKEVAEVLEIPYVNERWLGGLLTNFEQIKKSIRKLADMEAAKAAGEYKKYTKKEQLLLDREITRLDRFFGGLRKLSATPDILFVIDIKKEATAVREAMRTGVEVVAIVDTNSDPTSVDYPIPMNDDAKKALEYVLDLISQELTVKKILKEENAKDSKETKESK